MAVRKSDLLQGTRKGHRTTQAVRDGWRGRSGAVACALRAFEQEA